MKPATLFRGAFASALLFLAGCSRSISNSGYDQRHPNYAIGTDGYRGELSELDVVGVASDAYVSEADIQAALQAPRGTKLSAASKILLIQSGAEYPDAPMLEAMQGRFAIASFSGRPQAARQAAASASFAKTLRLVAAKGGYDKIVCYWGVLESEHEDKLTRTVSWVPIVGYVIPDKRENMRIKLKAAIVDVATGRWTFVNPPPASSSQLSSILSRRETDQALVEKLKTEGYRSLARTLVEQHSE